MNDPVLEAFDIVLNRVKNASQAGTLTADEFTAAIYEATDILGSRRRLLDALMNYAPVEWVDRHVMDPKDLLPV